MLIPHSEEKISDKIYSCPSLCGMQCAFECPSLAARWSSLQPAFAFLSLPLSIYTKCPLNHTLEWLIYLSLVLSYSISCVIAFRVFLYQVTFLKWSFWNLVLES